MTYQQPMGPVMIDLLGQSIVDDEKEKIRHPNTGGIILFKRNFQDLKQITQLCQDIRSTRKGNILICVDQEGGRVQRFQKGFTQLPPASTFQSYGKQAESLATTTGWLMATELLQCQVDFSFAPVLDVDSGVSEIIGNRSFSQDPIQASRLAAAFRNGMRRAGMAAVGKHFPGHGAIAADSHLELPIDKRHLPTLQAHDLLPFKALIADQIEGIMPAHIVYPAIDAQPAGFSSFWLNTILRGQLNFNGAIFSDDLSMAGAAFSESHSKRAQKALDAGCDMVLVCNNPHAANAVLESLPLKNNTLRQHRLEKMRATRVATPAPLSQSEHWLFAHNQILSLLNN
jgi:beta-N-acetylhexosaminidase